MHVRIEEQVEDEHDHIGRWWCGDCSACQRRWCCGVKGDEVASGLQIRDGGVVESGVVAPHRVLFGILAGPRIQAIGIG
jgi:hypothetical protein